MEKRPFLFSLENIAPDCQGDDVENIKLKTGGKNMVEYHVIMEY